MKLPSKRFAAFGAGESTSLRILREDRSNKKDDDSSDDDDEDDSRKQTVSVHELCRKGHHERNPDKLPFSEMDTHCRKPQHSSAGMDGRPGADRRRLRLPPRARGEGHERRVRNRSVSLHPRKM